MQPTQITKNADTRFVDDVELSKHIGISYKTLRRWRLLRRGPRFYKLGRGVRCAVRYDLNECLAWVREQAVR
jgi:hypothetical protein